MNNDQPDSLETAWANQQANLSPTVSPTGLGRSIAEAHTKEQRRLIWLNIREVIPALFSAAVFAILAPSVERPTAMFAASSLFLFLGLYMAASSIRHHRADGQWGGSVREQMERRLDQLHHRARLYQTTPAWYFLPSIVAMLLVFYAFGVEEAGTSGVVFGALLIVSVGFSLYKARKEGRVYEHEIERLTPILNDFDQAS